MRFTQVGRSRFHKPHKAQKSLVLNGPKAVQLPEEANRLTGGTSPLVLRTLAAAHAANKTFDKAVETSRRALQSAQAARDSELAEEIRREMSLYQAGLPYRAP